MKSHIAILLIISVIGWVGCNGSDPTPLSEEELIITEIETGHQQKTTFLVTDAASDDFKSVRVDIQSPIVVATDQGNISVPLPDNQSVRVDLLALDGVSDIVARHEIPGGTIQRITLTLANPEIILLDDTPLDASQIDLTPNLTLTPTSLVIPETGGSTVEIDIDVQKSVQRDALGKPIFRPQGSARHIGPTDMGVEAAERQGIIAAIPGIKDQSNSFLLRHPDKQFFVPVDASSAVVFNPQQTTFGALQKGQRVRVGGVVTGEGILVARRVIVIPENHRILRGVITNLNQIDPAVHTFDLRLPSLEEGIASNTIHVQYNPNTLSIRMERPETPLQIRDLTNGQLVGVHGAMNVGENRLEAQVILIHPEKFIGFVADATGCRETRLIRLVYPFRLARRLFLADPTLNPSHTGIIELGEAKTIGLNGEMIACDALHRGMPVSLFGRMIRPVPDAQDTNPVRMKAIEVKRVPVNRVVGEVRAIASDKRSFDLLASCALLEGFECESLKIHVVLSGFVPDLSNILAVGKTVRVAGLLESRLSPITQERVFFLFAVAIEAG